MRKSPIWVLCAFFMLLGIVIGFLWAPAKNGIYCGNNNGNNNMENCTVEPKKGGFSRKNKCKEKY